MRLDGGRGEVPVGVKGVENVKGVKEELLDGGRGEVPQDTLGGVGGVGGVGGDE